MMRIIVHGNVCLKYTWNKGRCVFLRGVLFSKALTHCTAAWGALFALDKTLQLSLHTKSASLCRLMWICLRIRVTFFGAMMTLQER